MSSKKLKCFFKQLESFKSEGEGDPNWVFIFYLFCSSLKFRKVLINTFFNTLLFLINGCRCVQHFGA
jgi:hypothetical protein